MLDAPEVNEHSFYPTNAVVPPLPSNSEESSKDDAVYDGSP